MNSQNTANKTAAETSARPEPTAGEDSGFNNRLTFKEDRSDTVLLNGEPLDEALSSGHDENLEGLVFPIGLHIEEEQDEAFRRLDALEGWTPILVCPDDMDLDCSVVSVWVETRGERVGWQKFAYNLQGDGRPIPLPQLSFEKNDYLAFIKGVSDRIAAERIRSRLASKPPQAIKLAEELERYDPSVSFSLLCRLLYDSSRSQLDRKRIVFRVCYVTAARLLFGLMMLCAYFYVKNHLPDNGWFLENLGWTPGAIFILLSLFLAADDLRMWPDWPPVFLNEKGLAVGWKLEPLPWRLLAGSLRPVGERSQAVKLWSRELIYFEESAPDLPPSKKRLSGQPRLKIEANGRISYLPGSGRQPPDKHYKKSWLNDEDFSMIVQLLPALLEQQHPIFRK